MSGILIRPFEPDDIEAYHAIHSHPAVMPDLLDVPALSLEERRAQVAPSRGERYLVAELDGVVVGAGELRIYGGRRNHVGHVGLAVHPDHWGRGIGTELMRVLIELGERWYGLRRIELKVFADNERAIELYRRFGFEVEATHHDFALRDGELATALSMARLYDDGDEQ